MAELQFAFVQVRDREGRRRYKKCEPRRYIVTRQLLKDKGKQAQAQLLDQPAYSYWAIVTNLQWKPGRIVRLYNGRATIESILKEGSLGFHMDSLPSQSFAGNGTFIQLLVLAYNLVNMFRRLCGPEDAKRQHVPALRRRLLTVPGLVQREEGGCLVHCATAGPHLSWLEHLEAAVTDWLAPVPGLRATMKLVRASVQSIASELTPAPELNAASKPARDAMTPAAELRPTPRPAPELRPPPGLAVAAASG